MSGVEPIAAGANPRFATTTGVERLLFGELRRAGRPLQLSHFLDGREFLMFVDANGDGALAGESHVTIFSAGRRLERLPTRPLRQPRPRPFFELE